MVHIEDWRQETSAGALLLGGLNARSEGHRRCRNIGAAHYVNGEPNKEVQRPEPCNTPRLSGEHILSQIISAMAFRLFAHRVIVVELSVRRLQLATRICPRDQGKLRQRVYRKNRHLDT